MNATAEDRWLCVDEIAAYLGIKRDKVYKWIERKRILARKGGILWKFKKEEIDQWLRSGRARPIMLRIHSRNLNAPLVNENLLYRANCSSGQSLVGSARA